MKSETDNFQLKSKILLVYAILCCFLLITNVVGWNSSVYASLDNIFNPFLYNSRNTFIEFSLLLNEINNKDEVLKENIELKRQLLKYDEIKVLNKDLSEQIKRLQTQTGIKKSSERPLRAVNIVGAQNVFSSNPELIIRSGSDQGIEVNDIVFYESNTILGFVVEVSENSSRVLPYYSPNLSTSLGIKIPAQNLRVPDQKGFVNPISSGVVKIINIPLNSEVFEGDIWITTNDSPDVAPNLILGRAKKITKNTETGFQEIELEVPFEFNKTTYVFVEN